ncbi:MAG: RDD family protein [Bacteroidetes bacterium]|nr:RDD family protein [Bacteroidota bacterium]
MQVQVRTTQNVFIHYPIASLGDRILAYLLDMLIIIVYVVVIIILLGQLKIDVWWVWLLVLVLPWTFYSLTFEITLNGQTPGKRAMNIKVIRMDGTPATIGDYLIRWMFGLVDIHIFSGLIAVLVISVGGKGQRLGDLVAGTTVVKLVEERQASAAEVFVNPETQHVVTFPQVHQLTERDIELIQQALEVNRDTGNNQPVMMVTEKVKSLLGIQTDLPPVKFLYTIIKDFQHLTAQ